MPLAVLKWRSAGQQVTSRCEALDQLDTDSLDNRIGEQELQSLIPQPGSSNESLQLRRLREIQAKTQTSVTNNGDSSTNANLNRRRQFVTRENGPDGALIETELYWSSKRLVWSRAGVVIRVFSYEEEIKCACWAWMDADPTWEKSTQPPKQGSVLGKRAAPESSNVTKKTDFESESNYQSESKKKNFGNKSKQTFRALCVFLPSCLVIYHPHSGQEYLKRLDLDVFNVFPLSIGLLIQRNTEPEDRKRSLLARQGDSEVDAPLSTLFYLRRPFDELNAVEFADGIQFSRSKSQKLSAKIKEGTKGHTFNEVDEHVIMVSPSPPILVSASLQGRCIRVYSYAHGRSPLATFEATKDDDIVAFAGQAFEEKMKSEGILMARRSTTDGQKSRIGPRPKLPMRKSARLESGSNRQSIGGPRNSMAGDRSRTSSGTSGHIRRLSGGLSSIYGQSGMLLDEKEVQRDTDEENIQEVMQLLEELGEVEEDSSVQHRPTSPTRQGTSNRRRTSRALNPAAVPPRTPYVKGRNGEERRVSRSRMSLSTAAVSEGNPISVAVELSQRDEVSKLAMTTSGDKAMTRNFSSSEGGDENGQSNLNGLSIFQEFAQGFAAVSLLEEIPEANLDSLQDISAIKAFILKKENTTLLHVMLSSSSKLHVRQIVEEACLKDGDIFRIRLREAGGQIEANNAIPIESKLTKDLLLTLPDQSTALYTWPPLSKQVQTKIQLPSQLAQQLHDFPSDATWPGLTWLNFNMDPRCTLTTKVISVCKSTLSPEQFGEMRMSWINSQARDKTEEWSSLVDLVLYGKVKQRTHDTTSSQLSDQKKKFANLLGSLDGTNKQAYEKKIEENLPTPMWSEEVVAHLLEGLNMVAQSARIDVCERVQDLPRLATVIAQLAFHLGWFGWYDYWVRIVPSMAIATAKRRTKPRVQERAIVDIFEVLECARRGKQIFELSGNEALAFLPRMKIILETFSSFSIEGSSFTTMSGSESTPEGKKAKMAVEAMLKNNVDKAEMRRIPSSIVIALQEAIYICLIDPPSHWSAEAYKFIGRSDLAKQIESEKSNDLDYIGNESKETPPPDQMFSRLFPADYRLKEVKEMLQTHRPIATKGPDISSVEDQEVIGERQKRVFVSASDRIKSLSVGKGMFSLSTIPFKSTEQWKTSKICLRIKMLNNCIIKHQEPDAEGKEMEWPEFHNGVASALQLAVNQDKVESNWLYSQLNKEFTSRHAGLMFGIGLLGQLRHLGKIHAHFYLSSRHSATTIGLLLGISLSFLGSCDPLAKALMSIHLIHTLPTHSRPLKTSMLEQSAALVGLGFVFLASKDRWASRMAFKAIGTEIVMTDDNQMLRRECFGLSAAISLGLTCLGQGKTSSLGGEIEKEIIPGLEKLIKVFNSDATVDQERQERFIDEKRYSEFEWKADISLTTTPASIALALIYLKSNRRDKAEKMPLPETIAHLDRIRPDLLTIRAICRSLILWDDVQPETNWLNSTLPAFLQFDTARHTLQASQSCQMAHWSLRVGSIFAIGLKYAGSNDSQAKKCLMKELHRFQSQVDIRPSNFFEKIRQQMLQTSVDVILTCLAIVLAGTGDVEVLQLLRKALYKVDILRYGNYMANSMAIGTLFLGAGRFTLSTSDSAIAALLIAFYPRYPINPQDNRCHLQAYRHLWYLAVEARLLSVEDIDNDESSRMPVELKRFKEAKEEVTLLSMPSLLPKLQEVESIQVASNRYFASKLNLRGNTLHRRTLVQSRKLYVKKRAADLSHDEDNKGKSSLRARTGGIANTSQLPLTVNRETEGVHRLQECKELRDMIKENTHDRDIHVLIDVVFGNTLFKKVKKNEQEEAFELFVLQSIMECLLEDKQEILSTMISLYTSTQAVLLSESTSIADKQKDIYFLQDLRCHLEFAKGGNTMLNRSFIDSLWKLIQDKLITDLIQSKDAGLMSSLHYYAANLGQDNSLTAWSQCGNQIQRQQLSCLFIIANIPPFSMLLELKKLVTRNAIGSALNKSKIVTLMQRVFIEKGYQTRLEILDVFVKAWLPSH